MTPRSSKLASLNRSWMKLALSAVIGVPSVLWATNASAQGWLADRRFAEGEGIRTGDLELHPGIGGEVGYDSNWFLRTQKTDANIVNGNPADAAIFRITPSFYVSTLGVQRSTDGTGKLEPRFITFRGGVSATGRIFIGKEMSDQHNIGLNSDARVDFNAGAPIGVGVFGAYNRLIQPNVLADPNLSFNRDDLRVGAEVIAIPGGGTFDMRAGYQIQGALFEETGGVPYSSITHEISVKNRWRFRPRTALFSETTLRFINYPNAGRAANFLQDSTPLDTRFGVTGLVSDRFGVLLAAGYGATFLKNPDSVASPQYDSFNGQAEGTFYLGGGSGANEPGKATLLLSTLSLGVSRSFQTSLLSNFYNSNRAYGRLEYWFGGKTVIRLDVYGEQLNYPQAFNTAANDTPVAATTGDFTNYRVGAGLFAEYRISSAFGINTTLDYVQQFSDTQLPSGAIPGTTTPGVYDLNYQRFQAFLGARYFY